MREEKRSINTLIKQVIFCTLVTSSSIAAKIQCNVMHIPSTTRTPQYYSHEKHNLASIIPLHAQTSP
jgi:hypothetical protein